MTTKRFKAAVIGGSGYGGAELIRLPHVELARVASVDFIGAPLANVHPTSRGARR
jgi:N-acetyl-gamma-glutamyl-phosphate reductase